MKIQILGTRGIPARHGGFETFTEDLSLYLVSRGHEVLVYCQADAAPKDAQVKWRGVRLHTIAAPCGALGTMLFDLRATLYSLREPGLPLVLGYNTAVFSIVYKLFGRPSVMNMDGIEWRRDKWSSWQRRWLRLNEWMGAMLSTHLVADHPEIALHLQAMVPAEKITTIPYGAKTVAWVSPEQLPALGLTPGRYGLVIARPEPENSVLEIVRAFSRTRRGYPLVVLGRFKPAENAYHREVLEAGGAEIVFPGAIYDKQAVAALRTHAMWYAHGHRVGGTNPSLVEALAAATPVIAHDNPFNRWVAGPTARYFSTEAELEDLLCNMCDADIPRMREGSLERHHGQFTLDAVNKAYEELLVAFAPSADLATPSARLTNERDPVLQGTSSVS